jgi:hypothetical protein
MPLRGLDLVDLSHGYKDPERFTYKAGFRAGLLLTPEFGRFGWAGQTA